ncbi:Hypothetical predicted protein [Mytilus galloprovincialis]|uniref:C1q domain-containing protein n=1 Tax=Mytilus galloprovincialis TaxID=29158 RepID=A0A8B6FZT2_MYTGA|nr:Hypothetical predicted protein [Mytilus galloprovincialis]
MALILLLVFFFYPGQADVMIGGTVGQDGDLRLVLEELQYLRAEVKHIKDDFRKLETDNTNLLQENAKMKQKFETENKHLLQQNTKMKKQIASVQSVNEVLINDVYYIKKENKDLKTKINAIVSNQNQTKRLHNHIKHSNNMTHEQFETNHVMNKRLLLPNVTPTPAAHMLIAFTAILSNDAILGPLQTVEYDKVLTNIGHAYDSRHGHFTAPIHGVYIIAATSCSYDGNVLRTEIVHNGVQVVAMYGADWDMGGHTIFIELNKDDMIWVRHLNEGQQTIHSQAGYLYSSFSGALLSSV